MGKSKNYIANKNKTFKIKEVKMLLEEALRKLTIEDLKKCVHRTERLQ